MPAIKPHEDIKNAYISGDVYVKADGTTSGTVYVGKKSAKSSTKKPKKTAPACANQAGELVAHVPVPWGSDPRFGRCKYCGKHLRRDASGTYM